MGRAKQVKIGQKVWQLQKDALEYYKRILNAYKVGDFIENEDFDDVFNLIKNHPDAQGKIGFGIKAIYVEKDGYGGQCFHIKRTDNSTEHFSYLKAVKG